MFSMKYQVVIFDLFGTLVENFPSSISNEVLRRMASELSVSPDNFTSLWHDSYGERMKGITKNYQECIRNICQQLGAQPTKKQIEVAASLRFDMAQREVMSPLDGAFEVLSYLKANSYKTGLISNCSMEATIIWEKTSLAPLIDVPVFSCLEGTIKPDPHIFQIAMERLAVPPENCLYVADGIGQELAAASKLGIHALLISAPQDSEYEAYREDWSGPKISSLKEVLNLL